MTDARPRFTVFTPTRNRAHLLHRPYESLQAQTERDFEWLIIDNASKDGTADLVAGWQAAGDMTIRYIRQEDRGLHGSMNRALEEARGDLMVTLASDDTCPATALERFDHHWRSIPDAERASFVGVAGLTTDEHGNVVGTRFPQDVTDSDALEIRFRHKVKGEKWAANRIDVMRAYPMPVIPGYTRYIPETIIWNAIARTYKTRYVNEVVRDFWLDAPVSLARPQRPGDNAPGARLRAQELLNHDLATWGREAPLEFFLAAARYGRWSMHLRQGPGTQLAGLSSLRARLLWLLALPVALVMYVGDVTSFAPLKALYRRLRPGGGYG
jgi:glycosyltransferase involved in cell wall biosynthesis